ncbi:MAG TPA: chemotaxis-specific protein-glutamate methyltransferase CheB [Bryobacteraceae bacterium]|jgi:two-component system chemotaxis response regulator CheB|nr:chemotaxis-specific protein-glutamate methyltransferase CheB [Bryobacteraceae bacterium]
MKKIRVLIIEDSSVIRQFLEHIISRDPRLEIAGAVETAEEALRILVSVSPDVISMDIRLPGMNGFDATQRIMQEQPTPIVVVSASVEKEDLKITMNALRAGALTVLEKPTGGTADDYEALGERICTQLAIMSQVKVVRRRRQTETVPRVGDQKPTPSATDYRALGIVSSTGGPSALVQLLGRLNADFPLPILLVQHICGSFLDGFACWLESVCPFSVEIVKDRAVAERGKVYLPAQDRHLRVESGFVRATCGHPVSAQRPSGTVLFESMAETFGCHALGVILTGMGDDGAQGLLALRRNGSYTIAEDESTAVVYGMPGEAVRLGAATESLPLPAIAPRILELVQLRKEDAGWSRLPQF